MRLRHFGKLQDRSVWRSKPCCGTRRIRTPRMPARRPLCSPDAANIADGFTVGVMIGAEDEATARGELDGSVFLFLYEFCTS